LPAGNSKAGFEMLVKRPPRDRSPRGVLAQWATATYGL